MSELKEGLIQIVGSENVSDDDFEILCYSRSAECPSVSMEPIIVVKPRTVKDVSEIVRYANRKRIPVTPVGGKSNVIDAWPRGTIAVDMASLNKLIEIDEMSMTVSAQAGMTWGNLYYELAKTGWTVGFKPHSWKTAALGGSVALCANQINGARYGLIGDQVVALEVVLPSGDIIRTGTGANTAAKKFQRYCYGADLTGLFIGSNGIFGIITEVTFKIYPTPEAYSYYGYEYETVEKAAETVYYLQRSSIPIESMYLLFGKDGLEKMTPSIHAEAIIFPLVLAGTKDEVEFYGKKLQEICSKNGRPIKGLDLSKDRLSMFLEETSKHKDGQYTPMFTDFCSNIPTLQVPKFRRAIMKLLKDFDGEKYSIKVNPIFGGHACNRGDLTFSPVITFDYRNPKSVAKARELTEKYFELGMKMGLAPHYLGGTRQKAIVSKLGTTYELLRTIKRALDPNNIMVPGMLVMSDF